MENTNIIPVQYSIFKGKCAARFVLQKATEPYRVGCIMLQMAPFKELKGKNKIYNWENQKISCKLGVNDLTNILYSFESGLDVSLFHEFDGTTKSITFTRNAEKGGYFLGIQQNGEQKQQLSIPISSQETYGLNILLRSALPLIHNWV